MDKKLNIYSWNVLNPNIGINYMTWKTSCGSKHSRKLAKIDLQRFNVWRKDTIISIIMSWLNSNTNVIICLQEVCKDLINDIKKIKNVIFHHTKLVMDNCQLTICKGLNVTGHKAIKLTINNIEKYALKVILDNEIEVNNLHLYWSWSKEDIGKAGQIIDASIEKEYIVICGDMNKTFTTIQPFLDEFNCLLIDDDLIGYTGIETETGNNEIIDHIILSANIYDKSDIEIISKINKYHIMYNIEKIINLYDNNWSSDKWIMTRKNKDISDHKPIKVSILCTNSLIKN